MRISLLLKDLLPRLQEKISNVAIYGVPPEPASYPYISIQIEGVQENALPAPHHKITARIKFNIATTYQGQKQVATLLCLLKKVLRRFDVEEEKSPFHFKVMSEKYLPEDSLIQGVLEADVFYQPLRAET